MVSRHDGGPLVGEAAGAGGAAGPVPAGGDRISAVAGWTSRPPARATRPARRSRSLRRDFPARGPSAPRGGGRRRLGLPAVGARGYGPARRSRSCGGASRHEGRLRRAAEALGGGAWTPPRTVELPPVGGRPRATGPSGGGGCRRRPGPGAARGRTGAWWTRGWAGRSCTGWDFRAGETAGRQRPDLSGYGRHGRHGRHRSYPDASCARRSFPPGCPVRGGTLVRRSSFVRRDFRARQGPRPGDAAAVGCHRTPPASGGVPRRGGPRSAVLLRVAGLPGAMGPTPGRCGCHRPPPPAASERAPVRGAAPELPPGPITPCLGRPRARGGRPQGAGQAGPGLRTPPCARRPPRGSGRRWPGLRPDAPARGGPSRGRASARGAYRAPARGEAPAVTARCGGGFGVVRWGFGGGGGQTLTPKSWAMPVRPEA